MSDLNFDKADWTSFETLTPKTAEDVFQEEQKVRANSTLGEALKVDPDKQAKINKLAVDNQVTPDVIEADQKTFEEKDKRSQIDIDEITKNSPATGLILRDYYKASVAHDDINVLESIEQTLKGWRDGLARSLKNVGESISLGFEQQGKGFQLRGVDIAPDEIAGLIPMGAMPPGMEDIAAQISRDVVSSYGVETEEEFQQLKDDAANILIDDIKQIQAERQEITPEDLNILQQGIRGGIESLGQMAPGFLAMLATGGRAYPMLTAVGTQSYTGDYAEARSEGLSVEDSNRFAMIGAAIEVGTELLPTSTLSRMITGEIKEGMTKEALKFAAREMSTEQVATILETARNYSYGLDEQLQNAESVEEMARIQLERQAVTAIATVVAGGTQAALASGVGKTLETIDTVMREREAKGKVELAKIDQLNADASESALKARDEELFRQHIENADGDQDTSVFMDAAQTKLYLNDFTREEIQADPALTLLDERVDEAAQLGGDVAVPVADFAATMTGTPHYDALRETMTLSEDATSTFRAEQERQETLSYASKLIEEADSNTSEYLEAQDIYENVRDQLVNTGVIDKRSANVMAKVVPAWATVYARRNNISVKEAYERSGLVIKGPDDLVKPVDVFNQDIDELFIPRTPTVEEMKSFSKVENVDLADAYNTESDALRKASPQKGEDVIEGYGDLPVVVKRSDGKHLIYDGHHRVAAAREKGDISLEMYVIEARDYDPSSDKKAPIADDRSDVDLLAELFAQEKDGPEQARGYYSPSESMIRLTEAADLSTFLHEFAHFMYEMELSTPGESTQAIHEWFRRNADDVADEASGYLEDGEIVNSDVHKYLDTGTTGTENKDNAIRRATHEQFARGFETYLMEGKAPSIELRNVFRKFARWLTEIYKAIRGDLKVKLDDEMRQAFDRLIATEEQIQASLAQDKYAPLFTDATMAGMTEEQYADYLKKQEEIKDKQVETLRDKLLKEITRRTEKWWKDEKADIVREQMDILKGEQNYRAIDTLKNTDLKLDHATVKERYSTTRTDKLGRTSVVIPRELIGMTAKGAAGVHPDEAAAFLGYSSGDEMVKDIIATSPIKEEADRRAEEMMKERHGDILNDGTLEKEADEAARNEARGQLLLEELKHLSKGTSIPPFDRQAVKALAEDAIAKLSFREIHPGKYRKAEIRAAQESAAKLAVGDREGAATAKTRQVLNYYLGRAATDAKNDIDKIVTRMDRYNKKRVQTEIIKAENGYWDQIVKILKRFEFRKSKSLKFVDEQNEAISLWAKDRVENHGDGLLLDPAVMDELYTTHWKNVPYQTLGGIDDTVRNIEHVARHGNKIRIANEEIDFKKLVNDWTASIYENNPVKFKAQRTTVREDRNWGRWAMAQMTKIPYLASWLDGGERVGLSHQILSQPLTDAAEVEQELWREVGIKVVRAIENRSKEDIKRHSRKIFIPEIKDENNDGNLLGDQVLAVALNTGNQGNLRKMLLGEGWAHPEREDQISLQNPKLQAILNHMTKSDWELVQYIWDQMEILYPQLAEVHKKSTGIVPPKVQATPVETPHGVFRGGYYPIKYDPNRSHRAELNEERMSAQVESMFSTIGSIQASVNAGATNERTKFYAPIRLHLDTVTTHFQETIRYITHHDAIRQINKLVRDPEVKKAIKETMGPDEYSQLQPWLNDVAKDGREKPSKMYWDDILGRLRFGVTLGAMGFKASTGVMQLFGLFNAAAEVGSKNLYQATRMILGDRDHMNSAWNFANENSKVLKFRAQTMDREIKNAMDRLSSQRGILPAIQEASMKHIALIQTYAVDLPTWYAAYIHKLDETGDEQKAYHYGDWVVENIQGSGATKDMARIMRNQTESGRMFTMFMTFFSALWNMERDLVRGAKSGRYSITSVAAKIMFIFTIPVILEHMLRGGAEDEEENMQELATKLALYPITSVPFVRDIASGVAGDFGYNISPIAQLMEQGTRSIPKVIEGALTDDEITASQAKGAVKFLGAAFGVPGTGQAFATGEHLYDVMVDGEELTFREFLLGPTRE